MVLLQSYRTEAAWFEGVDLLRKSLLTSVVLLVAPNTRLQLWFGSFVASVSVVVVAIANPYRSRICQCLQVCAS